MKLGRLFLLFGCIPFLYGEETRPYNTKKHGYCGGEYIYLWMKNSPAPAPLVVSGPNVAAYAPVLGQPNTSVILGNKPIDNEARSGAKFFAGAWLDAAHIYGLEANYLFLCERSNTKSVESNGLTGSPCLTFPFFNPVTGSESSALLAEENLYSAQAILKVTNSMQNSELNALFKILKNSKRSNLDILLGFLWWNFKEHLTFKASSPNVTPPYDVYTTNDQFKTSNNFYSGQFGIIGDYLWNRFFVQLKASAALGAMQGSLKVQGKFITNNFDGYTALQLFPAGYTAMPTNAGSSTRTWFSVLSQANVNLGYNVAKNVDCFIGYLFLYVTNVLFASNQIDRVINPSQAPAISANPSTEVVGEKRPKMLFNKSQFWVQGLNTGINIRF